VARGSDILLLLLRIVRFSELNKRPKTNSLVTMTGTASSSIHLEQFGHSLVILTPSHNRLAPGRSVPVFRGVLTSVELQIHGVRVTTLSKVSVQSGDKSPWPINASPLNIQGGSRTRESRTYSFVRGRIAICVPAATRIAQRLIGPRSASSFRRPSEMAPVIRARAAAARRSRAT
jgi:hypothetical protein